jgi:hypothetical protein
MTMVLSFFLFSGGFSNFNFIFNPVAVPTCCRNFHRQTVYHLACLDKRLLLVELYFEILYFL